MTRRLLRLTLILCVALTLFYGLAAVERACFRQSLNYNEGWNIYNAMKVSSHEQLYPAKFTWTTNNYPMLSFVLMAALHKVTGEYLFTGRAVAQISTVLLCGVVLLVLRELGATRRAALLGGLYCFALFAVDTAQKYAQTGYTNADDPQMLGLMLFAGALWLYVRSRRLNSDGLLFAAALAGTLGFCVKHSSVDLLVVIFVDALWSSPRRLVRFAMYLAGCLAVAIWLQMHYGGPWFLRELFEARVFERGRALLTFKAMFLPLLYLPLWCAFVFAAVHCRKEPRRIVAIMLVVTTGLGFFFGSSKGVSINCFFSLMVAVSIALGLWLAELERRRAAEGEPAWDCLIAVGMFVLLLLPCKLNGGLHPRAVWRESVAAERELNGETQFMAARPGAALCEDLLTCYLAGKPYVYDPFNTTRLIALGRIDETRLVETVERGEYSSIELRASEMGERHYRSERFTDRMLLAIEQKYRVAYQHEDVLVYVPRG